MNRLSPTIVYFKAGVTNEYRLSDIPVKNYKRIHSRLRGVFSGLYYEHYNL